MKEGDCIVDSTEQKSTEKQTHNEKSSSVESDIKTCDDRVINVDNCVIAVGVEEIAACPDCTQKSDLDTQRSAEEGSSQQLSLNANVNPSQAESCHVSSNSSTVTQASVSRSSSSASSRSSTRAMEDAMSMNYRSSSNENNSLSPKTTKRKLPKWRKVLSRILRNRSNNNAAAAASASSSSKSKDIRRKDATVAPNDEDLFKMNQKVRSSLRASVSFIISAVLNQFIHKFLKHCSQFDYYLQKSKKI